MSLSFPERLKAWRKRMSEQSGADFTQVKASKALGIGRGYYSQLETGRPPGRFLEEKFEALEYESANFVINILDEHLRVQADEGEQNQHQRTNASQSNSRAVKIRQIPLIGWAQAGQAMDFCDVVDWDTVVTVETNDPKSIAIRVRGDSMAPTISEGDIVVVACSDEAQDEQIVVARMRDEGVVLKQLKILDYAKRIYRMISFNPQYPAFERTADQFFWIYPVDQLIKKMRR